jgi:hypothetical protein
MELEQISLFRYLFATGPRHHVTFCYLKKGQSPPQGNEPFFDPFSGTKRHVTSWTNPRMPTTFRLHLLDLIILLV